MNNEININDIVRIETMPKVFSQLEEIGKFIDEQVKDIDTLACTEENKQEVKRRRTEVNNTLKILEDRRKEIKTKLLEPYEIFNEKYENECKGKLQSASEILKTKIDTIEEEQKKEKENELREFAQQHIETNNLQDIINFENIGLNITLSASMSSLKDQIVEFCKKIRQDLDLINLEEFKEEMLVEYKNNLDFAQSKIIVSNRHKMLNELKEKQNEINEEKQREKQIINNIEKIIEIPEEIIEIQFTIKTTKTKAKKVKDFLLTEGIEYE